MTALRFDGWWYCAECNAQFPDKPRAWLHLLRRHGFSTDAADQIVNAALDQSLLTQRAD